MTTSTSPRWNPNTLTKAVTTLFIGCMIASPIVSDIIKSEAEARCFGPAYSDHCGMIITPSSR